MPTVEEIEEPKVVDVAAEDSDDEMPELVEAGDAVESTVAVEEEVSSLHHYGHMHQHSETPQSSACTTLYADHK